MEPEDVAFQDKVEIDKSYVRCLKVLLGGQGYPMIATHDPRMVQIASSLASRFGRRPGTYEFQMLYGIRPEEQKRIADRGNQMRVYIPYGEEWYGYLMRRMAERPANTLFFLRGLATKG
jgi:proline dehydrogenase